jgi:branched-chain amino acid aminotransferase
MIVFLNGEFLPEEQATVSIFDRGFLYGDGLFETLRVFHGKPFRWRQHWERFERGATFLKIGLPLASEPMREAADQLIAKNQMPNAVLRWTLSRGAGARGYSPKSARQRPTLAMSLHPLPPINPQNPPRWKLITASVRLPANDPLAQFKTANKLPQILARAEADAVGADEALLLNTDGLVVEGAGGNLFWVDHETVCTPPVAAGILPGVTRMTVLEACGLALVKTREASLSREDFRKAQGVFLSSSVPGIVEARSIDGQEIKPSSLLESIRKTYQEMVRAETA